MKHTRFATALLAAEVPGTAVPAESEKMTVSSGFIRSKS
jgi:hypothetical protein